MKLIRDDSDPDVVVIEADGELNAEAAEPFVKSIEDMVEQGTARIIIDCTWLDLVSSTGIFQMLRMLKRVRRHGGDVKLCSIKGIVRDVLTMMRMDRVFEIYPDRSAARAAFGGSG